jgi:hypothetical protein
LLLLATLAGFPAARADVVAHWNFNSIPPDANGNSGTTAPATGAGAAFTVGLTVTNSFGVLGQSPDPDADNTSWRIARFPPQSAAPRSSGAQFAVDTTGYQNIVVTWAQRNSDTASRLWRVQYSANGTDFQNHTLITSTQNVWQTFSASFVLIPGANHNPTFAVRLVSEFGDTPTGPVYLPANPANTYSMNGTLWLDMVTFSGEPTDPFNDAPTISVHGDVTTRVDTATAILPFAIADHETPAGGLAFTATADNPALIEQLILSGAEMERSLQIIPAAGLTGETEITVIVTDAGGKNASTTFRLMVLPRWTPPLIAAIPQQTIAWNTTTNGVPVTLADLESAADTLTVTVHSTNSALFPPGTIVLSGESTERHVSFRPAIRQLGTDLLTIRATDPDGLSTSRSFIVKVAPPQTIASWNFNSLLPDGEPLTGTTDPATGTGTASPAGLVTARIGVITGSSDPAAADNSHWLLDDFATQGTSNKQCGAEFRISTAGYEDIAVFWDQRNSDSSSRYSRLQYTLNGADWMDSRVIDMPLNLWIHQQSVSFQAIPGAGNNPLFGVRLVTEFVSTALGLGPESYAATDARNNYGTGGTHRIDMVSFHGEILRPHLRIAPNASGPGLEVSWSINFPRWVLERNADLALAGWQPVTEVPAITNDRFVIALPHGAGPEFFRLRALAEGD